MGHVSLAEPITIDSNFPKAAKAFAAEQAVLSKALERRIEPSTISIGNTLDNWGKLIGIAGVLVIDAHGYERGTAPAMLDIANLSGAEHGWLSARAIVLGVCEGHALCALLKHLVLRDTLVFCTEGEATFAAAPRVLGSALECLVGRDLDDARALKEAAQSFNGSNTPDGFQAHFLHGTA